MVRLKGRWERDRFGWGREGRATNGVDYKISMYTIAYYGRNGTEFGWSISVGARSKQGTDWHQNTRDARQWLDDKVRDLAEQEGQND